MNSLVLDLAAACKHVRYLTGHEDTPVHLRHIHDSEKSKPAIKRFGSVADLRPEIETAQREGYGNFLVVNEGGDTDAEISAIRAVFIDADNRAIPDVWHLKPDFLVVRDDTHWHAYWRVIDLPVDNFRTVQRRLAAHYGTDTKICNPSRVMRLAGTFHQKVRP